MWSTFLPLAVLGVELQRHGVDAIPEGDSAVKKRLNWSAAHGEQISEEPRPCQSFVYPSPLLLSQGWDLTKQFSLRIISYNQAYPKNYAAENLNLHVLSRTWGVPVLLIKGRSNCFDHGLMIVRGEGRGNSHLWREKSNSLAYYIEGDPTSAQR